MGYAPETAPWAPAVGRGLFVSWDGAYAGRSRLPWPLFPTRLYLLHPWSRACRDTSRVPVGRVSGHYDHPMASRGIRTSTGRAERLFDQGQVPATQRRRAFFFAAVGRRAGFFAFVAEFFLTLTGFFTFFAEAPAMCLIMASPNAEQLTCFAPCMRRAKS